MADNGSAGTASTSERDIAKLQRWARVYTVLGVVVVIGLVVAAGVGITGVSGPGILTTSEALITYGGAIAVLAAASVFLLLSLRHTLMLAKAWRVAADQNAQKLKDWQQDAETEALRREQDARDREQERGWDTDLRAMEERLARRIDKEAAQLEAMMSHQEARLSDLNEEMRDTRRVVPRR